MTETIKTFLARQDFIDFRTQTLFHGPCRLFDAEGVEVCTDKDVQLVDLDAGTCKCIRYVDGKLDQDYETGELIYGIVQFPPSKLPLKLVDAEGRVLIGRKRKLVEQPLMEPDGLSEIPKEDFFLCLPKRLDTPASRAVDKAVDAMVAESMKKGTGRGPRSLDVDPLWYDARKALESKKESIAPCFIREAMENGVPRRVFEGRINPLLASTQHEIEMRRLEVQRGWKTPLAEQPMTMPWDAVVDGTLVVYGEPRMKEVIEHLAALKKTQEQAMEEMEKKTFGTDSVPELRVHGEMLMMKKADKTPSHYGKSVDLIVMDDPVVPQEAKPERLTKEQLKEADKILRKAFEDQLYLVKHLMNNGCVKTLDHADERSEGGTNYPPMAMEPAEQGGWNANGLPLPLIRHDIMTPNDFHFNCELAGRRMGQTLEKLTLGVEKAFELPPFSPIVGLANLENFAYYGVFNPESKSWAPMETVRNVLEMKQWLLNAGMYGPYVLVHGENWNRPLHDDYQRNDPQTDNRTLKQRLREINGLVEVLFSPSAPPDAFFLVQQTPDSIRMVVAMTPRVVQHLDGKIFGVCCIVPQLRADFNKNHGVIQGVIKVVDDLVELKEGKQYVKPIVEGKSALSESIQNTVLPLSDWTGEKPAAREDPPHEDSKLPRGGWF